MSEVTIRACRACMGTKDENLLLFSKELEERFKLFLDIEVSQVKFGPNFICTDCSDVITNFAKFKAKCMESEDFWRETCQSAVNLSNEGVQINQTTENHSNREPTVFVEVLKNDQEIKYDFEFIDQNEDVHILELQNKNNEISNNNEENNIKVEQIFNKPAGRKKSINKFSGNCNWCQRKYTNKKRLSAHVKICKKRDALENDEDDLNGPKDKNDVLKYYCGLCDMSTSCIKSLSTHLEDHEKSTDFLCTRCDFIACDLADYIAHRFEHHPKDTKTFSCHKCSQKFRVIVKFQFHYRLDHLQTIPGVCRFCDRTYTNYKMWKLHLRTHSQQQTLACDVCGRSFRMKHSLTQHMKLHNGTKEHMCDLCGFSTHKSYDLKSHIKAIHEESKVISCEVCGKEYKNVHSLRLHMRMQHLENKFTCVVCGKSYPSEKILKSHEIWHSDLRPFECHLCEKAFKIRSHLDAHIKTHSADKAYSCEVCLKPFTTTRLLKMHQKRNSHLPKT